MSDIKRPDNFCYAPWTNIEIMQTGKILPCCQFLDESYPRTFNITQDSISDYQSGEYLAEIKQQFLSGEWPRGCRRCQEDEKNSVASKRIMDQQRWQQFYDQYDINSGQYITAGLAFGNTCNLKCIICGPHASSKWIKEYKDIYSIELPRVESFRKPVIKSLTDFAPDLIHIDIYGGEPFLTGIDEHQALLDHYISTGQSASISIHYTTNGTVWPEHWLPRWRHFREVDIQVSIDGVGDRFEYLRYPATWPELSDNVDRMIEHRPHNANIRLSVAHTVSSFNVYYIDEMLSWCHDRGLPRPWINQVYNPRHWRPAVWPQAARQYIANHLKKSRWPEVKNWARMILQQDHSQYFEEFLQRMQQHDRYRGLDYGSVFPEMAAYI